MPENQLADAMRRLLTPTENAQSISQLELCCTSCPDVALSVLQQRLLSDIRTLGLPKGTVRIGSRCLIQLLQATPASPWRDLTPRTLAALLGGLSIHPHTIRFRRQILRGYYYSELQSGFLLAASFSESSSCKRQDRNTNPIFMAEFYENNSR